MVKKNKQKLLIGLVLLSILVITVGVTYAFFSYTKQGVKDNTITTGTLTFLYTEIDKVGAGIEIEDAIPMSDSLGKVQTGDNKVFNFKINADTTNTTAINYEITARKSNDSTLDEKVVKLYLTKVNNATEEEVLLNTFDKLDLPSKEGLDTTVEKLIYSGRVPSNTPKYEQNFRLRMWIDEETDFSGIEQEDGTMIYPYNDKSFKIRVNVYADGKVVTQEDIDSEANTNISTLSVEGTELTQVEDKDYNYETTLPEGTTETTINIETENPNATVEVEKLDNLAYETSSIKRLSSKKTLDLDPGNNYFKITIISESKKVEDEYIINIKVKQAAMLLTEAIFDKYSTIYENPTLSKSSFDTRDPDGLYKSTDTNDGSPTYYFRGIVDNYVDFAGFTWRVVRINEDGTIRLITDGTTNTGVAGMETKFQYYSNDVSKMYYSNSPGDYYLKGKLESWYRSKILNNELYSDKVVTGDYFCEQAKVAYDETYAANSGADMLVHNDSYTPNFKCEPDKNDKGIVNSGIGLLTYDEAIHSGIYKSASSSYLDSYLTSTSTCTFWLMSPAGFDGSNAYIWLIHTYAGNKNIIFETTYPNVGNHIRPVINLKAGVMVSGEGTSESHWVVQ